MTNNSVNYSGNNNLSDNKISGSTPNLIDDVKSASSGYSLTTDLKIYKLIISTEFIKLKISLYKKASPQSYKIDLLSKELAVKEKKLNNFLEFGKHFLKIATNQLKEEVQGEEIDRFSVLNGQRLSKIKDSSKTGVCQGACIEFAKKFHELKKEGSVSEKSLIKLASEFKSGVCLAGVAQQMSYEILSGQTNFFRELEPIKEIVDFKSQRLDENKIRQHPHLKNLNEGQKSVLIVVLYSFLEQNHMQHLIPVGLEPGKANNQMVGYLKNMHGYEVAREFSQLISSLKSEINFEKKENMSSFLKPVYEALEPILKDIKKSSEVKKGLTAVPLESKDSHIEIETSLFKKEERGAPVKKPFFVATENWNFMLAKKIDVLNEATKSFGLHFQSLSNELPLKTNDADYLRNIQNLSDGTYNVSITTGNAGHAILLLKVEGRFYLWDPNVGLIRCNDKKPVQTILLLLKRYEAPFNRENHFLNIVAISKNESERL